MKSNDVGPMLEYELLAQLLVEKKDDKLLIKAINKYHESGERVRSLK